MAPFSSPIATRLSFAFVFTTSLVLGAAARGQAPVRTDDRSPPARDVTSRAIEAAIYLELYGHPNTAHQRIEVRAFNGRVELSGSVASDADRRTAAHLAALAAPNRRIVDRLEVERNEQLPRADGSAEGTLSDLKRRFTDSLAAKFPPEIMRELNLTVYLVEDPSAWVVTLEGVVPSARDQLALSETLLFGSPSASAVVNRTYVSRNQVVRARPDMSIRVPFVGLDVDVDRGVDLDIGPLGLRVGGGARYRIADDPRLLDEFMAMVRSDADLRNVELRPHLFAGVLTIEGRLTAADKMRAVALGLGMRGIRGVVDRAETIEGGPDYYRESDLAAYLRHRLGEHAGARDVELVPAPRERFKLAATVSTNFHAVLAATVLASDPAIGELPIEPEFREATPDLQR